MPVKFGFSNKSKVTQVEKMVTNICVDVAEWTRREGGRGVDDRVVRAATGWVAIDIRVVCPVRVVVDTTAFQLERGGMEGRRGREGWRERERDEAIQSNLRMMDTLWTRDEHFVHSSKVVPSSSEVEIYGQ